MEKANTPCKMLTEKTITRSIPDMRFYGKTNMCNLIIFLLMILHQCDMAKARIPLNGLGSTVMPYGELNTANALGLALLVTLFLCWCGFWIWMATKVFIGHRVWDRFPRTDSNAWMTSREDSGMSMA